MPIQTIPGTISGPSVEQMRTSLIRFLKGVQSGAIQIPSGTGFPSESIVQRTNQINQSLAFVRHATAQEIQVAYSEILGGATRGVSYNDTPMAGGRLPAQPDAGADPARHYADLFGDPFSVSVGYFP